jgi:hypothetical protein
MLYGWLLPSLRSFVSVASKGLRLSVSPLDATLARYRGSVANKGVTGAVEAGTRMLAER